MKRILFSMTLLLTLVFVLGACESTGLNGDNGNDEVSEEQERFEEVMDHLQNSHYKTPSEADLYEGAIEGMMESLDDPFSRYYSDEEYQEYHDSFGESFVGIGVTVENVDDNLVIRKVWEDSPANRAGMQAGDVVTHIDGEDYRDKSYIETIANVRGEEGSTVSITVDRPGVEDPVTFEMEREEIENPTVEYERVDHDGETIGYITIHTFGSETLSKMESAVETLEDEDGGIDGLIIDLRDNSGGYLNTLNGMLDLFLTEGDKPMFTIEQLQDGEWVSNDYDASGTENKPYDILTMVNGYSASASEVFAAAMKEKGGYDVLGTPTYGKGTMQASISLESTKDELHLSQGRWLTPNGEWVDPRDGDIEHIAPTIEVEQNPYFSGYNVLVGDDPLVYDTVSDQVENAQRVLSLMGYDVREDGYFDEATRDAVEDLQDEEGLEVTGEIDEATGSVLSEYLYDYRTDKANDDQYQAALDHFTDDD
ncbi:MAG: S41 family peptidase [Candidatus Izemoplasmataceae bacterium]